MTEYKLPFTCKQRDKALWVYALIVSPILAIIGLIKTYPDFLVNHMETKDYYYLPLVIHLAFFLTAVLVYSIEHSEKFPTFKCKCENEQPSVRSDSQ